MNSRWYHFYEKKFYFIFYVSILFLLARFVLVLGSYQTILITVLDVGLVVLYVVVMVLLVFISARTKKWFEESRALSKKIGLSRILIMKSTMIISDKECYEIHHQPYSFLCAWNVLRKRSKKENKQKLNSELESDYRNLSKWLDNKGEEIYLISITHEEMAGIWIKTSSSYFEVQKTPNSLDPYVKMNLFQWVVATFKTTGKMKFHPPQEWQTYYFKRV